MSPEGRMQGERKVLLTVLQVQPNFIARGPTMLPLTLGYLLRK